MALAHSANAHGIRQDLLDHLRAVATQAADFARPWGADALADVVGWLHDIGKFNPEFQRYLREAEAGTWRQRHGPDHKGAGATLANRSRLDLLCFLIHGHHGGLHARADLKSWLTERQQDAAVADAIALAHAALPDLEQRLRQVAALPPPPQPGPTALDLYLRMLFSALVDADFLDTERHFQPGRDDARGDVPDLPSLWEAFQHNHAALMAGAEDTWVNRLRDTVYRAALDRALAAPGFYRLTGPTGIGKTRVSLGFALRHALAYDLRRIVYAIPYTSITEQTADEFGRIFAHQPRAVLEHHSAITPSEPGGSPTEEEVWRRLAAENWDAPIVVTTTVQLFESLFAASPAKCRKLHNLARSVIILDEAQMLPTHVLTPILDVLSQLVSCYGATVVFCTATQPALDAALGQLSAMPEIVPDPPALFAQLKRVSYTLPAPDERWSWDRAADTMLAERQALTIVNTRANAVALLEALRARLSSAGAEDANNAGDALFHLSTWMAGAHRRAVLSEVRRRLAAGEPCWLVSTQVVEAGVDVDFPLVLRALAPLDRIVQAAGRCNRNGRLAGAGGRVIVFVPEEGRVPRGVYSIGTDETLTFLHDTGADLHDPDLYERYFRAFYSRLNLDSKQVQEARHLRRLDFPETQSRFQMIEDDTAPVVITQAFPGAAPNPTQRLLAQLATNSCNQRHLMRSLQPYIVGLPQHQLAQAQQRGLVREVTSGLGEWLGKYDPLHGIVLAGGLDPGSLVW